MQQYNLLLFQLWFECPDNSEVGCVVDPRVDEHYSNGWCYLVGGGVGSLWQVKLKHVKCWKHLASAIVCKQAFLWGGDSSQVHSVTRLSEYQSQESKQSTLTKHQTQLV